MRNKFWKVFFFFYYIYFCFLIHLTVKCYCVYDGVKFKLNTDN